VCSISQSDTSITSTLGMGRPSAKPNRVARISLASTRMCWGLFWNLVTYQFPSDALNKLAQVRY
jgi:hypothetical protein